MQMYCAQFYSILRNLPYNCKFSVTTFPLTQHYLYAQPIYFLVQKRKYMLLLLRAKERFNNRRLPKQNIGGTVGFHQYPFLILILLLMINTLLQQKRYEMYSGETEYCKFMICTTQISSWLSDCRVHRQYHELIR